MIRSSPEPAKTVAIKALIEDEGTIGYEDERNGMKSSTVSS
jgi:hypothetical protein